MRLSKDALMLLAQLFAEQSVLSVPIAVGQAPLFGTLVLEIREALRRELAAVDQPTNGPRPAPEPASA